MSKQDAEKKREFVLRLATEFKSSSDDHQALLLKMDLATTERAAVITRLNELHRLLQQHGMAVDLPWSSEDRREES